MVIVSNAFSQDWPIKKEVNDKKARGVTFIQLPVFNFTTIKTLTGRGNYQELKLSPTFSKQLLQQKPEAIKLSIPLNDKEFFICELVRFELGNIKFTENNNTVIENVNIPVTYRGIVPAELKRNIVTLTVNEDYLSLIASFTDKAIQITKADETDSSIYRLYNSKEVQYPVVPFDCGTKSSPSSQTENGILINGIQNRVDSVQNKCVNVFVECFDSLYRWRGSNEQQTINYVYELFNAVATGFSNEQINIQIAGINVWTTADPYRGDNRTNALADLAANYKDEFWGNICVGLDRSLNSPYGGRSGVAGEIGKVKAMSLGACPAYSVASHQFCYNDMNYSVAVKNFPVGPNTTGQQIYLVMHEIGHLLGAHHTKWCGWKLTSNPDTYGTLDSCGARENGPCAQGPPTTTSGATIMSYCVTDTTTNFVNYNNGFGTLPGNAIRNFVDQTWCIPDCLACLSLLKIKSNEAGAYAQSQLRLTGNKILKVISSR